MEIELPEEVGVALKDALEAAGIRPLQVLVYSATPEGWESVPSEDNAVVWPIRDDDESSPVVLCRSDYHGYRLLYGTPADIALAETSPVPPDL